MSEKSKNLTKEEKEKIFLLIQKYKNITENKETDSNSIVERKNTWEKITNGFNATSCYKRTTKQIRIFYKNAKCALKKQIAFEKKERFKTGGGSFTSLIVEENNLFDIVADEITPLQNNFDSSSEYFQSTEVCTFFA